MDLRVGVLHNLMCEVIIYPIYLVLFLCIGTLLYRYEICFVDSVRLTLLYKTHVYNLMHTTKLNKMCMIFVICG